MIKLWKVCVNNLDWDCAAVLYAKTRSEAEKIADKFPASEPVEYAGNFRESKADDLLGWTNDVLNPGW